MNKRHVLTIVAVFCAVALVAAVPSRAFQVITQEQLEEGLGARSDGNYFSNYELEEPNNSGVSFNASARSSFGSDRPNWYGRTDGGGRFYGDRHDSNYQACANNESNIGALHSMHAGGFTYPCQRFR